ncbi:MAG: glycosyltransferase family 4 protein [Phycisphaeraceae bacterium]|nr:glycosyltransferase family 4 protein [Phycisphaeraceae bacterium]
MRILHVIPQFPWFGGRTIVGGHASCLLSLGLAQAAAGHEVTILSHVIHRAGVEKIADGLHVHSLFGIGRPGTVRFGLRLLAAGRHWLGERPGAFDVLHGHSGFADYLLLTAALARRGRLPSVHTMYCPIAAHGGRARLPLVHAFLRGCARRIGALSAMSLNVARSMEAWGSPPVTPIPPALDFSRFFPPPIATVPGGATSEVRPLRRELGLGDDDIAVLFVGNAKPQKNLAGLLRAVAQIAGRHDRLRLIITTELKQSSSDEHLQALHAMMRDLGLEDRIIQRGIVDNMPELMRSCDILAAPFLDSNGPSDYFMAVLEAMACGRAVVCSAIGGMPEVVSDEVGGLVDPLDQDDLAAALERLVVDRDLRQRAGARAREVAAARFDPAVVVESTGRLYAGVMS